MYVFTIPFSTEVSRVHPVPGRFPTLHPAEEVSRAEVAEMLGARGAQRRFWVRQGPTAEAKRLIGRAGNPAEDRRDGEQPVHLSHLF